MGPMIAGTIRTNKTAPAQALPSDLLVVRRFQSANLVRLRLSSAATGNASRLRGCAIATTTARTPSTGR